MLQFQIQFDSKISAETQLYNHIRSSIIAGQLKSGQKLPSTRQLALQLNLDHTIITETYSRLVDEGLLEHPSNLGFYVCSHPVKDDSNEEELPLIHLFTRLQEAGFPLGLEEYFLLLKALQKGFGLVNHEALAELCRTLWVKSRDEEPLFNYHFKQVMKPNPGISTSSSNKTEGEVLSDSLEPTLDQGKQDENLKSGDLPALYNTTLQEIVEVQDEIQVAQAVRITTCLNLNGEENTHRFMQSDEYFPLTRRQMKQSWRNLRRMVREGAPVEIDIEATIEKFSRHEMPLNPVLIPTRINRTELILLIDQKGSMVPFHILSQRLIQSAKLGGRLREVKVFYFHNCPIQYLYHDPNRREAEPVSNLLKEFRPDRSVVLIFSDAGAARGSFNPERLELTKQFLNNLKEQVRYIAWLNPMAENRWVTTTAGEIAQRVPMFEMSREGMERAIDVLRGRSHIKLR
ncbi:MAG: GntR family transcriptional regulator [Leptolyngbyaceae cyanobacterium bins.302]|nr:GntR family transcriptional regulator [Leptolyngbyaceae cyanobacterium bins.302]